VVLRGRCEGAVASRYVALMRGINVGRAKRVAMGALRDVMARLGYPDCRSLLNATKLQALL
jgi:uncharacterized protein (DUF1697 family)